MIVSGGCCRLSLKDFGILIPLEDNRVDQTLAELAKQWGDAFAHRVKDIHPAPYGFEDLTLAHTETYVSRLFGAELEEEIIRTYELKDPLTGQFNRYDPSRASRPLTDLRDILLSQAAGTHWAALHALKEGFAYFLGGGAHHARSGQGSGFCLVNDVVISARKLIRNQGLASVWIVDVDAHKGDGTAELCREDPNISTVSLHMAQGWPLDLGAEARPWAHIPSTLDIGFEAGEEASYLTRLKQGLASLRSRLGPPQFAFVLAGADPWEKDGLPSTASMRLSLDQLCERDRFLYEFFRKDGVPVCFLMAGGYGHEAWKVYTNFLIDLWQHEALA